MFLLNIVLQEWLQGLFSSISTSLSNSFSSGDLKNLMSGKKEDNVSSVEEAFNAYEDDQECEFLDAEEGEFKDPDYSTSNLAFKTAITDDEARKIIEGKQLK